MLTLDIRKYEKLSDDSFEESLSELRKDQRTDALLRIMDRQVHVLAQEGQTDLVLFLSSLDESGLMPIDEELPVAFKHKKVGLDPCSCPFCYEGI